MADNPNDAKKARRIDDVDRHADDGTIVDVWLFKIIGLYHLLWPTASVIGTFGILFRKVLLVASALMVGTYAVQIAVIYLAIDDFTRLAYMLLLITTAYTCVFKAYVLLRYADKMWPILELAAYTYTSSGRRHQSELVRCRDTLSIVLRTFVTLNYCTLTGWLVSPLLIHEPVPVTNLDGTIARYRTAVFNLWTPLSEQVYNSPHCFATIYLYECFVCSYNVLIWTVFDCYVMTVCYVLNANFRTVNVGYQTLGQHAVTNMFRDQNTHSAPDHFNDLAICIKDNQKIIKKYDEFYDIIQSVVLVQISMGSVSVCLLIYFTFLMYVTGWSLLSMPVIKFSSGALIMGMQLFFYCHAFAYVETAKSAVNFGLYSGNWTEMDLKFKKTLLLAMNMNSSHKRTMKLTPLSIVNLEMFSRVMKMSYSIVSLLLNTSVEQPVVT